MLNKAFHWEEHTLRIVQQLVFFGFPPFEMNRDAFHAHVAPLLMAKEMKALRCVDSRWQDTVDQLLYVKGVFGTRNVKEWSRAEIRYALGYGAVLGLS